MLDHVLLLVCNEKQELRAYSPCLNSAIRRPSCHNLVAVHQLLGLFFGRIITDRIGHAAHDDRNYAGCLFGCTSWRRTYHDDDVNLEPNQISRELLESIRIPIAVASLCSNPRRNRAAAARRKTRQFLAYRSSRGFNTPIRGSFPFCWAVAASGHAAAAPPTSVMNSRRFITSPKPGDGILAAQTGTSIGAKPSRALLVDAADVAEVKIDVESRLIEVHASLNSRNCLAAFSCLCQPLSEPPGTSPSVTTSQDDCSDTCYAIQNSDKSRIPPVIRNAPIARMTPKRSFMTKTPIRTPNRALHSLMAETGPIGR